MGASYALFSLSSVVLTRREQLAVAVRGLARSVKFARTNCEMSSPAGVAAPQAQTPLQAEDIHVEEAKKSFMIKVIVGVIIAIVLLAGVVTVVVVVATGSSSASPSAILPTFAGSSTGLPPPCTSVVISSDFFSICLGQRGYARNTYDVQLTGQCLHLISNVSLSLQDASGRNVSAISLKLPSTANTALVASFPEENLQSGVYLARIAFVSGNVTYNRDNFTVSSLVSRHFIAFQ